MSHIDQLVKLAVSRVKLAQPGYGGYGSPMIPGPGLYYNPMMGPMGRSPYTMGGMGMGGMNPYGGMGTGYGPNMGVHPSLLPVFNNPYANYNAGQPGLPAPRRCLTFTSRSIPCRMSTWACRACMAMARRAWREVLGGRDWGGEYEKSLCTLAGAGWENKPC